MAKATKATNDKLKELAELLAQKEIYEAKHDFWKFCKYIDPVFFSDNKPHLILIAEKLQAVADGKTRVSVLPMDGAVSENGKNRTLSRLQWS